ncbi:50S ribosomal protein L21 [candidate division GN15 bacterium]|jgi:large subunit ribosomal protein L21|nr:50S ribosomal protein L21 [candidate division GN15 bacterium]
MYAVFQLSGFQFAADEGDVLKVPQQSVEPGQTFDINEVLIIRDGDNSTIGTPLIENASVQAEVLNHGKDDKVLVYKYKRRTKYRRTQGHRQDYSEIKVNKIIAP